MRVSGQARVKNHQGLSLVEMIISLGIFAFVISSLGVFVFNNSRIFHTSSRELEATSDLGLMRATLTQAVPKLFYGSVFLNPEVLKTLTGSKLPLPPEKFSFYSILPFVNRGFKQAPLNNTPLTFLPLEAGFDLILLLGPQEPNVLQVVSNPLSPQAPYDFSDPELDSGMLVVQGNLSFFQVGDVIALTTENGTQILTLNDLIDKGNGTANLTFGTLGYFEHNYMKTKFPLSLVGEGARIAKVNVYFVGVESKTKFPFLVKSTAGKSDLQIIHRIPQPASSMQILTVINRTSYSGDIVPLSFRAFLKIEIPAREDMKLARRPVSFEFIF